MTYVAGIENCAVLMLTAVYTRVSQNIGSLVLLGIWTVLLCRPISLTLPREQDCRLGRTSAHPSQISLHNDSP